MFNILNNDAQKCIHQEDLKNVIKILNLKREEKNGRKFTSNLNSWYTGNLIYYLIKKILYNWKFVIFLQSWGLEACNEKCIFCQIAAKIYSTMLPTILYTSLFKWIWYQRGLWCHTSFNVQMAITSNGTFCICGEKAVKWNGTAE